MLLKGLVSTRRELEAGLADAEAELARTEEYCRKLEELIAVGRATLHAATQANFQPTPFASVAATPAAGEQPMTDAQKRMVKDGQK
jgi:hypothetical protein